MSYDSREWLEADGLGGFASGTASGIRTRRYHAVLLVATAPPWDGWCWSTDSRHGSNPAVINIALTSQRYASDVVCQDGADHIREFKIDPWPRWIYALSNGCEIEHGLLVQPGRAATMLYWRMLKGAGYTLAVRPLMSGRDYHSLHHENPGFNFAPEIINQRVVFHPYDGVPGVAFQTSAAYSHQPEWYRNFLYSKEQERGLDCDGGFGVTRCLSLEPLKGRSDFDHRAS